MQNISVFIDNKRVDLPTTDLILNMTYALRDKSGITVNTGSRSEYSFEFPATNNNNQIFSRFWDIAENTANKQIFLDAYIEVNGMAFFQGKCQLTGVDIRPDLYYWQGKTYKVAFYGNNVDWTVQIGNKFLYEYDFGTHVFDETNIFLGLNNNIALFNYKYILIKWKDWSVANQVDIFEFTPALFIKSIVDIIFADINYTVSSNFFNTNFFKRLVMPIPLGEKITDPQYGLDYLNIKYIETYIANAGIIGTFIPTVPVYIPAIGPNPYNAITGDYTIPTDGYYLFRGILKVYNMTTATDAAIGFSLNGIPPPFLTGQTGIITDTTINYEEVAFMTTGQIALFVGSIITAGAGTTDIDMSFEVIGEADIAAGLNIDFRYFINQTWNSLDFIRGLAHAFNLTFETDVNNRIVTIEPSDTYLYQSNNPTVTNLQTGFYNGQTYDKTLSVDLLKEGEIFSNSDIQNQYCLSWQYDSNDPTLEALNSGNGLDLMQAQFIFPANRFQSGQEIIENPFFSASLCIADETIRSTNSALTPLIPIIWSTNYLETPTSTEANYDIMPRILYSEDSSFQNNGQAIVYFPSSGLTDVYLPPAYMVDYNTTNGNFISLSFGNETVNGFNVKGLLERFYLLELIRIQGGKQVECFVFWNVVEIFNLDFRKYVKIHGDNFILQEINSFNVAANRSTKTYLLNNYQGNGTEASQIENTLLNSKLNA